MKSFLQFFNEGAWYNDTLHPAYWDTEGNFDKIVREKLLDIAQDFADNTDTIQYIKDIQLTGSLANYNYTKYSDLDVHLLLDFKDINPDEDIVKKALDGVRWIWNTRHDIIIREHEVELYFQDVDEPHAASGLFSLLENKWIHKPEYDPPEIDERDVTKKAEQFIRDVNILQNKFNQALSNEQAGEVHKMGSKLKEKLHKMRRDSLMKDGEFGIGNLAFKYLRNNEVIKQLIDITSQAYDKKFNESKE